MNRRSRPLQALLGVFKKCSRCQMVLETSQFTKQITAYDGLRAYCKHCSRVYQAGPRGRTAKLRQRYGLTLDDWATKMIAQSGRCAVCWEPFDERSKSTSASLDHDHETSTNRDLVHNNCNLLLGCAQDDIEILQDAIDYLKRHGR